jgi:mRNA-degrading endonuclease RelE of RelBE toxin-antitoxin system
VPNRLLLSSDAQTVLRTLHPETKRAVRAQLQALKETWPSPRELDVKRLDSEPDRPPLFRLRIGDWRVVFRARADVLEALKVFHRRDGYGWMERE